MKQFYMIDVQELLKDYEPGRPNMKPDVIADMVRIEKERRKKAEQISQNMAPQGNIMIQQGDGQPTPMKGEDIIKLLKGQQDMINKLKNLLQTKEEEIARMGNEIISLKSGAQVNTKENSQSSGSNFDSYMQQINK